MTPKPTIQSQRLWRLIGRQVTWARVESGQTNATAFALTVRITRQHLNLIETGQKGARLETLYRIAKATGKPIAFFLPPAEDV